MKNTKTNLRSAAILAGVLATGTATSMAATESNEDLLSFTRLGSGGEVRAELIRLNGLNNERKALTGESTLNIIELTCGEGKCGEGKCGEKEEDTEKTKEGKKTSEDKTDESKCGESKCGEEEKSE